MWKYVRFFNSSRFLAFEPFEFWIISVSEVLFDSDSLPFPLFHVQCYSMQVIAMQDVFNKFDKDTTTVQHRSWMWQRSDSPTIQPVETESECWDKLRQRLPRKRRVRTPELHDGWRDVCLTRTEVVLWKDESSPRSLRSTFQRRSIWIYVSIFDRQLYWEGITEVFDLPSFQATKSRVSWN